MYDIAIIGAGPGGSTLARLIGKRYKVLLLDKRQLDIPSEEDPRFKCCGGLLDPDAQKMLGELGLGVPKSVLVGPQLFVVRTIDLNNNIERYYQRFYTNIDREKFDRWAVSLITGGVDCRFGCVYKSHDRTGDSFIINYTDGRKEYTEKAKILIGADGASSKLRRNAFGDCVYPKEYISIQECYEAQSPLPYFSAIFDSEITDFYSWTIPKGEYLILGSALKPKDNAHIKFELLKKKLADFGFENGKMIRREGAFILRPSERSICIGDKNIALLGEAAGLISPSSAEGFSYAFKSALLLGKSLEDGPEGFAKRYKRFIRDMRLNILVKNLKVPFMYNSSLRNAVMKSGIQSVDVYKEKA